MSYTINNFNGQLLTTINDGVVDTTSTSLKLLGKGITNYGEAVAENFVHILENFARTSAPSNPLIGQLWYHIDANGVGNHTMKVCKSVSPAEWIVLGGAVSGSSSTAGGYPTAPSDGDLFWDGEQLWVWSSSNIKWELVGPMSTTAENTNISYSGDLVSDGTTFRSIIKVVINGKIIAIFSDTSTPFTPNPAIDDGVGNTSGFPIISGGMTLHSDYMSNISYAPLNTSSQPSLNSQYDFGSSTNRWRTMYTDTIDTNQLNVGGATIAISNFMRKDTTNIPTSPLLDIGASVNPWGTGYFKNIIIQNDPNTITTGDSILKIPVGTTSERPLAAIAGTIRYNSTTTLFEGKSSTGWNSFVQKTDSGVLTIPSGTTAERPADAVVGSIRYNTTLSTFEGKGRSGNWVSFDIQPGYDIPFLAGWNSDFTGADLAVQTYGRIKLARSILIQDFIAEIITASVGASIVMDIKKNGTSIFTTKPIFSAGSTILTAGILNTSMVNCSMGDIITFSVEQIGTTTKGQKITVTLKGIELQ